MKTATENATHTPGPWEVEDGIVVASAFKGKQLVDTDEDGTQRFHERGLLALVYSPDQGDSRNRFDANARLIAAAPDLLESCRALLTFAETLCADAGMSPNNTLLNVARAVIQQAEGAPHVA